uniref:J domain-containing protein n=1 Tax=Panagrolaimus sp. PS1159 TaxID=55785 RepID=A0AC35FV77_9BILA
MNKTLLKSGTFLLSIPTRFVSYVPRKRNYYEVLGIEKSATLDEIKQAFAVESRKLHPDSRGSTAASAHNSTEKFMELKEAYDFLKKPQKRKEYDRELEFSRTVSRDMFYENPGSDYETINLNVRGPGGGLHRSQHPPIKPSRFGHFFDPTKEMEREKQNDKFWKIFAGTVLIIIIGNILYVTFFMNRKKKIDKTLTFG